jgi:hypothetical protein
VQQSWLSGNMVSNYIKKPVIVSACIVLLIIPIFVLAVDIPNPPAGGLTLENIIDNILSLMWKIAAVASVIAFIISGFLFLTALGDANKLTIARTSFVWGIVGVVVTLAAFSIPLIIQNMFEG